jgi:hypothetical protein
MTIDERIEALTQSVELLATLHRDLEQSTAKNFERLEQNIGRLTTTVERLANVVISHQERIDRIEGK